MSSIKSIFTGPPKPKKDPEQERMLAEELANERKRAESADRALMSSRRARLAGGARRGTGLGYVSPATVNRFGAGGGSDKLG
jgi:hypothetical protein